MTTESALQALLAPLAAGGCWPMANTAATIVYPYIVFYEIVGLPEATLDGYAGLTAKRFQIDCFAKSYGAAKALRKAVNDALKASSLDNLHLSEMDGEYNPAVKDYQSITEFSIWSTD